MSAHVARYALGAGPKGGVLSSAARSFAACVYRDERLAEAPVQRAVWLIFPEGTDAHRRKVESARAKASEKQVVSRLGLHPGFPCRSLLPRRRGIAALLRAAAGPHLVPVRGTGAQEGAALRVAGQAQAPGSGVRVLDTTMCYRGVMPRTEASAVLQGACPSCAVMRLRGLSGEQQADGGLVALAKLEPGVFGGPWEQRLHESGDEDEGEGEEDDPRVGERGEGSSGSRGAQSDGGSGGGERRPPQLGNVGEGLEAWLMRAWSRKDYVCESVCRQSLEDDADEWPAFEEQEQEGGEASGGYGTRLAGASDRSAAGYARIPTDALVVEESDRILKALGVREDGGIEVEGGSSQGGEKGAGSGESEIERERDGEKAGSRAGSGLTVWRVATVVGLLLLGSGYLYLVCAGPGWLGHAARIHVLAYLVLNVVVVHGLGGWDVLELRWYASDLLLEAGPKDREA